MADTTTDLWGNIINAGAAVGGNILQNNALTNAQNQYSAALGQAGQYVQGAQQTAAGYAAPYMAAGVNAIPGYSASTQAVGTPLTMDQFQNSPYYQVGLAAQEKQANQLKAGSAATGMYGSGNMANALNQNALTTMMGSYDTAAQRQLQNQQAANTARYNEVGLGQNASQNLGNQTLNSAQYMAGLAQAQGLSQASTTNAQAAANNKLLSALTTNPTILSGLTSGTKAIYDKLAAGGTVTPAETTQLTTELDSIGGTTDFSDFYKGVTDLTTIGGSNMSNYFENYNQPSLLGGSSGLQIDPSLGAGINYQLGYDDPSGSSSSPSLGVNTGLVFGTF